MPTWFPAFAHCLDARSTDNNLYNLIDELLEWYATVGDAELPAHTKALLQKHGEQNLRVNFEALIDRLAISCANDYEVLFGAELNKQQAKNRYRQIIRVFHPDRGVSEEAWLNSRAEKVNAAYQRFVSSAERSTSRVEPSVEQSQVEPSEVPAKKAVKPAMKRIASRWLKIRYRPMVWRRRFGNSKQLQTQLAVSLVGLLIAVVLFFVLSALAFGASG